jgi:hypothetical protein
MVHDKPLKFKYPFTDPRHELIYGCLEYLQKQEFMPGINSLGGYLAECHVLNKAGGENYIRFIFRGIEGGRYE